MTPFETFGALFAAGVLALTCCMIALDRLGPEPELGAADYRQMQCEYMPDAPECNVKRVQIAEVANDRTNRKP